jgi:hypothetical protein
MVKRETGSGADAAKLCALVYSNGKIRDRFAMTLQDAVRHTSFLPHQSKQVVAWAILNGWMRLRARRVELTAAGIYVATVYLDLPQQERKPTS